MRETIIQWLVELTGIQASAYLIPDQTIMLCLAFLTVMAVGMWRIKHTPQLSFHIAVRGMLLCLSAALFGGYMLSLLLRPSMIAKNPLVLLTPWKAGLSSLGAVGSGLLVYGLYLRRHKQSIWLYADELAPIAVLGLGIARIGCFMHGCDYGRITSLPWGLRFPVGTPVFVAHKANDWIGPYQLWSLPVHPYPLYLLLWNVALAALFLSRQNLFRSVPGNRAVSAGYLYFGGRFFIEFARSPYSGGIIGFLNPSQYLCLIAIILLYWLGSRRLHSGGTAQNTVVNSTL